MNLRELILNAPDLARERVEVPEWKDEDGKPVVVWVSEMSAARLSAWLTYSDGQSVTGAQRVTSLLVNTITDDAGAPVFTVAEVDQLAGKNSVPLVRLYEVAKRVNGIGQTAVDDAEKK